MLFAAVMPSDASCRKVIWNTSNSNVASVSNGEVLAIARVRRLLPLKQRMEILKRNVKFPLV